jgi:hypothetical protein
LAGISFIAGHVCMHVYLCMCDQVDGRQHAALRLEESGHAVLGYTLPLGTSSNGIHGLLDTFERTEYSPNLYERDIVEVCTCLIRQSKTVVFCSSLPLCSSFTMDIHIRKRHEMWSLFWLATLKSRVLIFFKKFVTRN